VEVVVVSWLGNPVPLQTRLGTLITRGSESP
jgi:hypothetical protein